MTLRPATPADVEIILHHRREMFREMGGDYERQLDRFEDASRKYFESALADGSYYGIFGEIDHHTVAGGGVVTTPWPGSPLNHKPRRAWILNIFVEPPHRSRGYAKLIMQALIEWCRDNCYDSVALHASEFGRSLYEKLGFRPTNEMRLKL